MKRLIAILLLVLLPCIVLAENTNSAAPEDFQCALQADGTLLLVNYAGKEERVVIPDSIDGYPLTAIGYSAFYAKDPVYVYIPEGILKIEGNPFRWSTIKEIEVSPENPAYEVTNSILYNKAEHKLVCFPSGLSGEEFLSLYCKPGEAYEVPVGTEIIGEHAFHGDIPDLILPDTVKTLEGFALWETFNKVYVPESVVDIQEDNFGMDDTGVVLECMPGSFAERYYLNCGRAYQREKLYYPVLPFEESGDQGIEQVEGFRYPVKRKDHYLYFLVKDGTAIIYDYEGKEETLVLPEMLDGHPVSGVIHCTGNSLKEVVIPDCITRISGNPFSGCPYLQEIRVSSDHPALYVENGALMLRQENVLLSYPRGKADNLLDITWNVEAVGEEAFRGCEFLHTIILPKTVRKIHARAFWDCWNLKLLHIPSAPGIEYPIADYDLGQVEPAYTSTIDATSLDAYFDSVVSIESLEMIASPVLGSTSKMSSPYYDPQYTYQFMNDGTACLLSYQGNEKDVIIPEELGGHKVSIIGEGAFSGNEMETLVIPDTVRYFGYEAFSECASLKTVSLPANLIEIGEFSFYNCSSLSSVSFPESLRKIGLRAFSGCTSLQSVSFSEGIKVLEGAVFEKCENLKTVLLPDSLEEMSDDFIECYNLQMISIPAGVRELGDAFTNCRNLSSVIINGRLTDTIGTFITSGGMYSANPFEGCENVVVTVPKYSIAECGCKINGVPFIYLDE